MSDKEKLPRCNDWSEEHFMMDDYYEPSVKFSLEELYQAFKARMEREDNNNE